MIIHPQPPQDYNPKKRLGYLHIYTGTGKGKTSAALGVLLRAAGQGLRVTMIQFIKGHKTAGELLAVQKLGNHVEIVQFGRADLNAKTALQTMDNYLAAEGLKYARDTMRRRRPDVLILDEITTAVDWNLLPLKDVVNFLDNRHQTMETILTGHVAHPALLNLADLVTVFQPTKDYFRYSNFEPRYGIEY